MGTGQWIDQQYCPPMETPKKRQTIHMIAVKKPFDEAKSSEAIKVRNTFGQPDVGYGGADGAPHGDRSAGDNRRDAGAVNIRSASPILAKQKQQ